MGRCPWNLPQTHPTDISEPGRELGAVMKFLNTEESLKLSVDEAEAEVLRRFS